PPIGHENRRFAPAAVGAGMAASPIGIDGPAEGHARPLGYAVESGFGPDFVEPGVQRLGCVEVADHRGLAVAGKRRPLLGFDREVVPTHERMFAHGADGPRDYTPSL